MNLLSPKIMVATKLMTREERLLTIKTLWHFRKRNGKFLTKEEIAIKCGCSPHTLKADLTLMRKKGIKLLDRRTSKIDWDKF